MLFFPERDQERRQPDPQRSQAVDPRMARYTKRNEKASSVLPRPAGMNDCFSLSAAGAAPVAVA